MRSTYAAPTRRVRTVKFWAAAWLIVGLWACSGSSDQRSRPLSPHEALETFQIVDGFRVELFAAEPYVIDPVEIAFDENGGVYVAEVGDNPEDPPPGHAPLSRIAYLEDTDGDGVIDKRTVFADKLLAVEGVLPWKGGVIATAAPDILWLKDTDGDHKADVRKVLYTGFYTKKNVEGRLSNPRLGLDNWIYVVNHGFPGEITSPDHPDQAPVQVRGREFRFHPTRGLAEAATGDSQFGLSFNQWGHAFLSQNTVHLRHTVIPTGYLRRNPYLVAGSAEQDISDHGRPAARVFPISKPQQWRIDRTEARRNRYKETRPGRIEQLEGYFTASCGVTVYLGDAFPEEYAGNVFVTDGNGNLVHRDVLAAEAATYRARRLPLDSDFLASTDNWFRPVNFANAADGNLYVIDYYRQYLEHPEFIPDAVKKRLEMDFRSGDTLGRIYRIVPEKPRTTRSLAVQLGSASTGDLVGLLSHSNGWHRRTAHRLLLERQDSAAVPGLRQVVLEGGDAVAELHALWLLEEFHALDPSLVKVALSNPHPAVREHGLQLAEQFFPQFKKEVLEATDDESPRVQFQAALSLGNLPKERRVVDSLAKVAARYPEDRWFQLGVLSAPPEWAADLFNALLSRHRNFFSSPSEGKSKFLADLGRVIGARRKPAEVSRWLAEMANNPRLEDPGWKQAGLEGLVGGLALESGTRLRIASAETALIKILQSPELEVQRAAAKAARFFTLNTLVQRAKREVFDENLSMDRRSVAVAALCGGSFSEAAPILESILTSPSPRPLQLAAVETLDFFDDPQTTKILLRGWRGYSAETRNRTAEVLIRHRHRVGALLEAIDEGAVDPSSLDPVTRIRLLQFPDPTIQRRAAALLKATTGDRRQTVAAYEGALELTGRATQGKTVFERECAKCHLSQAERGRIGPDLSGVNNRGRETLLNDILNPSDAITDRYTNYLLETKDGRLHDGTFVAETAATVTLRGELEDITVLRSSIAELRASSISLMPEGLEEGMSRQELADVIAYLRAGL